MRRLGWWWNGCWGTLGRRDVWLEQDPTDGRLIVRWRGWDWRDRDGRYWTYSPAKAVGALQALLGADRAGFRETLTLDSEPR